MSLFFSATANKKAGGGGGGGAVGLIGTIYQSNLYISGSSGRMWGWGQNGGGVLAIDIAGSPALEPASVIGAVKTFCKIADGGGQHALAITNTGRVWSWGNNLYGSLGINSTLPSTTPISILGAVKTFCEVSCGIYHSLAIDKNGRAWAWGENNYGQIGDNTIISKLTPVSVLGAVKTFCKISGGKGYHTVAIDKNGRAWAWGVNFYGQIGDNTIISKLTPVSVLGAVKTFCKISAGTYHTTAITNTGRVWCWGNNFYGGLGDNTTVSKFTPVSILGTVKTFCEISGGDYHTVAIDKNGRAWGWGYNLNGWLGDGTTINRLTPVSVLGTVKTFCKISTGNFHTIAIDKNGKVWGWGLNNNGQIGIGISTQTAKTPVNISGIPRTFSMLATAAQGGFTNVTVGISNTGRAWGWGSNGYGQIGDNTIVSKLTPVSVLGAVKTFCKIATSGAHVTAIDKNGRAWAWGYNATGQLGNNAITSQLTPVSVLGAVKTFCEIVAAWGGITNSEYSLAIDKNGRAWGWGYNFYGQLGNNAIISQRTPVSVLGAVKTFCKISAGGGAASMAVDKNGRLWGWGFNLYGQLGDNTIISRRTPVSVLGAVKTFCVISGGYNHSTAIDKNGRAWAWGYNTYGQIGNNTQLDRLTPVSVLGAIKTFCKISAGNSHTLAIDKNGRAWGWGANYFGVLGDNTTVGPKLTPVSIAGAAKTFCHIFASGEHSLAIDKNGKVWGWGNPSTLGSGISIDTKTPVQICNL